MSKFIDIFLGTYPGNLTLLVTLSIGWFQGGSNNYAKNFQKFHSERRRGFQTHEQFPLILQYIKKIEETQSTPHSRGWFSTSASWCIFSSLCTPTAPHRSRRKKGKRLFFCLFFDAIYTLLSNTFFPSALPLFVPSFTPRKKKKLYEGKY